MWQLLDRLDIGYKRGRDYVYSPDPYYWPKLHQIELAQLRAWCDPEQYVLLYLDELTYYRQPSLARAYDLVGHHQPLARRSYQGDSSFRIIGAVNALTGQLTYRQASKISLPLLSNFYAAIQADYPQASQIYVVLDNWPVHFHPDVLARLQPQQWPWPPKLPAKWPTQPSAKAVKANLPLQLLGLPTYASWLNPTEKLWRWLKQEVLHLHPYANDWAGLKQRVADFLAQFRTGSLDLLRYSGLLPEPGELT